MNPVEAVGGICHQAPSVTPLPGEGSVLLLVCGHWMRVLST